MIIYYFFTKLHLNNNVIKFIPEIATNTYIILAAIGTPKVKKVTKLKLSSPTKPQFRAPIKTNKKESLSNQVILHIKTPLNKHYLKYIYEGII